MPCYVGATHKIAGNKTNIEGTDFHVEVLEVKKENSEHLGITLAIMWHANPSNNVQL